MTALVARELSRRFGRTVALRGVTLTVDEGEVVALLGPNGAGKTTLMKIACGLVRPDEGTIEVFGAAPRSRGAGARIGFLSESFRFPSFLTAEEVLALHQRLSGSRGGSAERGRLLELVDLAEHGGRRVGEMSRGMQQRLGLAQALIGEPELVLLDEPTSALDAVGRRAVRSALRELRDRGCAVLLNSHLLTDVELVSDRIAILSDGRLLLDARLDALLAPRGTRVTVDAPTLEEAYVATLAGAGSGA